jgi:hypothetical protein
MGIYRDEQDKKRNKQNQKVVASQIHKITVSLFHDKGDLFFLFFFAFVDKGRHALFVH